MADTNKIKKARAILNIIALVLFIGVIIYVSIRYTPQIVQLFERRQELKEYIESKGALGIAVFIFFQVLQIIVAAIPGEIVQIAGGYLYGTFWGTVYLVIGVVIGSIIVFYASRLLGYGLVKAVVSEKNLESLYQKVNGKKFEIFMLILFLIPGIPKDMLTYIAGLTPIKPMRFLVIAVLGRLPALMGSTYIGAVFQDGNYTAVIILSTVAIILFAVGLLFKDKIINKFHSILQKK